MLQGPAFPPEHCHCDFMLFQGMLRSLRRRSQHDRVELGAAERGLLLWTLERLLRMPLWPEIADTASEGVCPVSREFFHFYPGPVRGQERAELSRIVLLQVSSYKGAPLLDQSCDRTEPPASGHPWEVPVWRNPVRPWESKHVLLLGRRWGDFVK